MGSFVPSLQRMAAATILDDLPEGVRNATICHPRRASVCGSSAGPRICSDPVSNSRSAATSGGLHCDPIWARVDSNWRTLSSPLPGPEEQAIAEASQRVGNAIIAMENGTGSQAQLTEAALALAKVRKEAPGVPVPNRIAAEISASLRVPVTALAQLTDNEVKSRLADAQPEPGGVSTQWIPPGTFYPFEQRTSFYCGPATAESILYYLGGGAFRTARSYDPIFAAAPWYGYPTLLRPNETNTQLYPYSYLGWDQDILADPTWLNTYAMGGTSWGKMKEGLNKWTNQGTFYREVWTGGGGQTLRDSVWPEILSSIAYGFPAAENVKYSPSSYTPTGFNTSATYEHWDVIYGGRNEGWIAYIGIGQVYGEPYRMYPFQEYYWSWQPDPQVRPHWSALSSHHGVVLH